MFKLPENPYKNRPGRGNLEVAWQEGGEAYLKTGNRWLFEPCTDHYPGWTHYEIDKMTDKKINAHIAPVPRKNCYYCWQELKEIL